MPTTRPRFQVTETPEVERALTIAERAWPDVPRAERVSRLLELGADALQSEHDEQRGTRLAAIDFTAGSLEVAYGRGYLDHLRDDWPA